MNSTALDERASKNAASDESKWGYAIAGAIAIGFAAVIQLAFGGLDDESLANMPAVVSVPYEVAGKLGVTVTLGFIGLCLIARDVFVNRAANPTESSPSRQSKVFAKRAVGSSHEEELPLAEEEEPTKGKKPVGAIIAALNGRFEGRGASSPATTGGPTGDSNPTTPSDTGGQMVLSSAKYLNRNAGADPGGNFRRGNTQHTSDE